jgi:hypothetical protein
MRVGDPDVILKMPEGREEVWRGQGKQSEVHRP